MSYSVTVQIPSPLPEEPPMNALPVRHEVVTVTPELAQAWLAKNQVNRSLRQARVDQYARAMATGHWTVTNDDLCIAPDGTLLNGQHRLNAVIQAGVPVRTSTRMLTQNYVYLFLKAWNYWVAGKKVAKISMQPKGEEFIPEVAEWNEDKIV